MRTRIGLALTLAALVSQATPARAIDEVIVELPLVESTLKVNLNELTSPEALMQGSSDLAELDRASNGELGRTLLRLLNQPVPVSFVQLTEGSVGTPLLQQALLLVSPPLYNKNAETVQATSNVVVLTILQSWYRLRIDVLAADAADADKEEGATTGGVVRCKRATPLR